MNTISETFSIGRYSLNLNFIHQVLHNLFTTTNKLKVNSFTVLISGLLNCVVVFFLLKNTSLGIYAIAGASSVITIIRSLCVTVPYAASLMKFKWYVFYRDVGLSIVCYGIVCAISLMMKCILPIGNWISFVLVVVLTCVFSFVIQLFVFLNKNEQKKVLSILLRRNSRRIMS